MQNHPDRFRRFARERGATIVLVAVAMVMLLSFAALAVDVSYVLIARNELQNAADAAALGGAAKLYPASPTPNWSAAETKATATIPLNKVTKIALTNGSVQSGYWNLTGSPAGLQAKGITPGARDVAAVMVTLSKSIGNNGGPVSLFFAPVFGKNTMPAAATAVAVVSFPGTVGKGQLFPIAINKCLYDHYWDSVNNQPLKGTACPAAPPGCPANPANPGNVDGCEFCVGSAYHYAPCESGQWTSFFLDDNNTPTIQDLMANKNPTPMSIDDEIWIEPGTKNVLFHENCPNAGCYVGQTVLLPVVSGIMTHAENTIKGFGPFVITATEKGGNPYIRGHFTTGFKVGVGSGGGPNYGAFTPPSLAK